MAIGKPLPISKPYLLLAEVLNHSIRILCHLPIHLGSMIKGFQWWKWFLSYQVYSSNPTYRWPVKPKIWHREKWGLSSLVVSSLAPQRNHQIRERCLLGEGWGAKWEPYPFFLQNIRELMGNYRERYDIIIPPQIGLPHPPFKNSVIPCGCFRK